MNALLASTDADDADFHTMIAQIFAPAVKRKRATTTDDAPASKRAAGPNAVRTATDNIAAAELRAAVGGIAQAALMLNATEAAIRRNLKRHKKCGV